jgi:exodeoxyribonuclease VII large subunit
MSKDQPAPVQHSLFGFTARPQNTASPNLRPASAPEPPPSPTAPPRPPVSEQRPTAENRQPVGRVVLTVGELTRQIKDLLEYEYPRVWVQGEVSGFRGRNPSGHLYFNLKDQDACIETKVWSSVAQRMKFELRDGLSILVEGSIDVYEPRGRYSLIVQRIEPAGQGALALAFQQLKERLAKEGLLGDNRKRPPRPIPFLPRRIGVVTSVSGAALRDFLRVLHRRHPRLSVLVCDARVQGDGSAGEVVRAIRCLARTDVDVIVVTRGGGSVEDLWTFNEEVVARAIAACPKPVVTAIGHEVDFTIADFVADFRAPTPSAAAEKLAPVLADLELALGAAERRLNKALERQILAGRARFHRLSVKLADPRRILGRHQMRLADDTERMSRVIRRSLRNHRAQLQALEERLDRRNPRKQLAQTWQEFNKLAERLRARARQRSATDRRHFNKLETQLEALSPLRVLARGYSVTLKKSDGSVVRQAADVAVGEEIAIKVAGAACERLTECEEIDARVTGTRPR